jgi:hypothetical protein
MTLPMNEMSRYYSSDLLTKKCNAGLTSAIWQTQAYAPQVLVERKKHAVVRGKQKAFEMQHPKKAIPHLHGTMFKY